MTDEEIFRKATEGDETAFLLLYERHRDAVYRFVYRLLCNAETAEDIVHDCFLALIKNPQSYDSQRAALRTYLFAAARNLAMKHFRGATRNVSVDDIANEPEMVDGAGPLAILLSHEIAMKVQSAVSELPTLQREVLILFEYEGMSLARQQPSSNRTRGRLNPGFIGRERGYGSCSHPITKGHSK